MELELAQLLMGICVLKSALEVFVRLKLRGDGVHLALARVLCTPMRLRAHILSALTCVSPHLCLCPKRAAVLEAVVWRICPPRPSTSMEMTKWIVKVCEIVAWLLLTRAGALGMGVKLTPCWECRPPS